MISHTFSLIFFAPLYPWRHSSHSLAAQHDVAFIVDEVQSGVLSSGTFWAHEQWGLDDPPDIVTFAKKMQVCGWVDNIKQNDHSEKEERRNSLIIVFNLPFLAFQNNPFFSLLKQFTSRLQDTISLMIMHRSLLFRSSTRGWGIRFVCFSLRYNFFLCSF